MLRLFTYVEAAYRVFMGLVVPGGDAVIVLLRIARGM